MISRHSIKPGEIEEFVADGEFDVDDMITVIKERYPMITRGVLWNVSSGSFADHNAASYRRIAHAVTQYARHQKTAYYGPSDLKFGLLRMYEAYAEIEAVPPVTRVFRDRDEAIAWLDE